MLFSYPLSSDLGLWQFLSAVVPLFTEVQRLQRLVHTDARLLPHARHRRAAIWADIPRQFHQPVAMMTFLLQLGMAIGAHLPVVLDSPLAAGAERKLFQRLQQVLFLERVLVFLFQ